MPWDAFWIGSVRVFTYIFSIFLTIPNQERPSKSLMIRKRGTLFSRLAASQISVRSGGQLIDLMGLLSSAMEEDFIF